MPLCMELRVEETPRPLYYTRWWNGLWVEPIVWMLAIPSIRLLGLFRENHFRTNSAYEYPVLRLRTVIGMIPHADKKAVGWGRWALSVTTD